MSTVIILLSVVVSTATFAQSALPTPVQRESRLAKAPSAETDAATEALLKKIFTKAAATRDVRVAVEAGVITLEGSVPTRKDSDWVQSIVQRLPDVLAVVDNVSVRGPSFDDLNPVATEFRKLFDRFQRYLPSLIFTIVFLLLAYFLSGSLNRGIRQLWSKRILNPFLLATVTRLTLWPIWIFLFYIALKFLGFPMLGATIIGGTSVLGIVLGLAFKGIAENYLAGLLLATRSPFTRGDLILVGAYKGYVQNLNMRGTTIIDLNGNLILIPNLMVIQSVVENQTANPKTRTSFIIGIGYQDSIARAQELIIRALDQVEGVIRDPAPAVVVHELGSSRVELRVLVWFDAQENRELRVRSRAMIKAKETLLANGFSIPNDTREIIFSGPLKIENSRAGSNEAISQETRKTQIQQQAASNLSEPEALNAKRDPSPEDMLKQAEKNPLPMNVAEKDLLKKPEDPAGTR